MPAISLVVCVYQERDLLVRMLAQAAGCYDDLVVVHDGPDSVDDRSLVVAAGGRFIERPRAFQEEAHWPFIWGEARHDWILRLDADEFPGEEMKQWLQAFRRAPEPSPEISGYTCCWPLWDGRKQVSEKWPSGRNFMIHRQRVRHFGMAEQLPIPDGRWQATDLVLRHQPRRKSYGLKNVVFRRQAYQWRERIASSLLQQPKDLGCWRWEDRPWPANWEQIRARPWRTAVQRLTVEFLRGLRAQWRAERKLYPDAAINGPIHHALICWKYWQLRRKQRKANR